MNNKAISNHVVPSLKKSILSIGKLYDSNYTAVFTKNDVKICKTSLNIPKQDIIFTGHRNATNGLHITDLHKANKHSANKVDRLQNVATKNAIAFL